MFSYISSDYFIVSSISAFIFCSRNVFIGCLNNSYHSMRFFGSTVNIFLITSSVTSDILFTSFGNLRGLFFMLFTKSTIFPALYGGLSYSKELRAEQKLIKASSNRPDVSFSVILSTPENFRSHIQWWAKHCLGKLLISKQFRKPKIRNFDFPVVDEDVCQFKIPVHDFVLHQSFKGVEHLD